MRIKKDGKAKKHERVKHKKQETNIGKLFAKMLCIIWQGGRGRMEFKKRRVQVKQGH